jgi:hypothetical protein
VPDFTLKLALLTSTDIGDVPETPVSKYVDEMNAPEPIVKPL